MRISSPLALSFLLVGCGASQSPDALLNIAETEAADTSGKLLCATGGGVELQRVCISERISGPDGTLIIVRHPDGGFRRFRLVTDGRGLVPADGAETADVKIAGSGIIEVSVGGDRYHLPARVSSMKPGTP